MCDLDGPFVFYVFNPQLGVEMWNLGATSHDASGTPPDSNSKNQGSSSLVDIQ